MEKGRGKGTDTLQTDNVFTRKEYIEREAVENVIEALAGGFNYIECGWKYAVGKIRAVPAADVVLVRHGRWETVLFDTQYMGCRPKAHYCSECHQITWFRTFYCPNCGTRMDKENE